MNNKITSQTLLSTLWVFILFNMIFRDLHQLLAQGYIEEMMALEISNPAMLFYGIILEIPIAMVLLSRILKDKTNKWTNIVAASFVMLGTLSTLPSADWDDIFFVLVKLVAFLAIIRVAWKLPSQKFLEN
ncbi:MAG: hypothetical protein KTR22_05050 [Flavobacteriaceae bacterium]|nr:hypothetical protein [Flavobacteriaceae bacterium]